jgi:hypothetical protein
MYGCNCLQAQTTFQKGNFDAFYISLTEVLADIDLAVMDIMFSLLEVLHIFIQPLTGQGQTRFCWQIKS